MIENRGRDPPIHDSLDRGDSSFHGTGQRNSWLDRFLTIWIVTQQSLAFVMLRLLAVRFVLCCNSHHRGEPFFGEHQSQIKTERWAQPFKRCYGIRHARLPESGQKRTNGKRYRPGFGLSRMGPPLPPRRRINLGSTLSGVCEGEAEGANQPNVKRGDGTRGNEVSD
jgi:hypothetical protein